MVSFHRSPGSEHGLVLCLNLISSGAQLGSIGDLCRIWGSSFILVP
ncbi:hypothetical protein T12_7130 [Trichinella patagoniensis]|uniref:Uncharacterized protein n=1 Tax=Trichinella patagoniensis TaxID=990121 RepID=A0A0V0YWH0_9BILA|nr:hypothetical protein T12_7130 [Trichinella patagoniensis]